MSKTSIPGSNAAPIDASPTYGGMSRRQLLAGIAAASAGAGVLGLGLAPTAQADPAPLAPFTKRGRLSKRPNFLVIMIDEQRQAVSYESAELTAWRATALPGQNALKSHGIEFTNHQIMSAACAPSRASFWTGQYPSLHGVSQTTGAAKSALESDVYWLHPHTVPTMGNYFRAAGYETVYRGKWHVSEADLFMPGTNSAIPTYDSNGTPDDELERFYEDARQLDAFGFDGWVGPEPHGSSPLNSGSSGPGGLGRDETYARLSVDSLTRLRTSRKPWLLVTSFVNPHDITLWGAFSLLSGNYWLRQQIAAAGVPVQLFMESMWNDLKNEDLSTKPSAQASYRGTYSKAFQPMVDLEQYAHLYYALQQIVDGNVNEVLSTLMADRGQWSNTVVMYVSDHGELLGSHGGLYQKWHQTYDEVLRVPWVVHNPVLFPHAVTSSALTSHADVLPTMLGLAGVNVADLQRRLAKTHDQVQPLVGRDLSGALLGEKSLSSITGPVYFMTEDEPTKGANQTTMLTQHYEAVSQPNHIETVIARLPTGTSGSMEQWKYSRYFDNDQFWSTPGTMDVTTTQSGSSIRPGESVATTVVKLHTATPVTVLPPADEFELYNMTLDPTELANLAGQSAYASVESSMVELLSQERTRKRLVPVPVPTTSGSSSTSSPPPAQGPVPARPTTLAQLIALEALVDPSWADVSGGRRNG